MRGGRETGRVVEGEAAGVMVRRVPRELAQVTAEEVRVLAEAVACGRTGVEWTAAQGGTARVFRPRPGGHEVRLRLPGASAMRPTTQSVRLDAGPPLPLAAPGVRYSGVQAG